MDTQKLNNIWKQWKLKMMILEKEGGIIKVL